MSYRPLLLILLLRLREAHYLLIVRASDDCFGDYSARSTACRQRDFTACFYHICQDSLLKAKAKWRALLTNAGLSYYFL
jgi:hypothetical protein